MSPNDDTGEWIEYRRLILKTLEDVNGSLESLEGRLTHIENELLQLRTKATIWGGVVGGIVGILSTLGGFIVSYFGNN